jgi:hypothetical protein
MHSATGWHLPLAKRQRNQRWILDALSDRLMRIEDEKIKLLREIEERLRQRDGADVKRHLRRLAALDRYAQRSFSTLRKR